LWNSKKKYKEIKDQGKKSRVKKSLDIEDEDPRFFFSVNSVSGKILSEILVLFNSF
jgi:hypothetical protein